MRSLLPSLFCLLLGAGVYAAEPDYSSLPDWQRAILDKAVFELRLLPATALFPHNAAPADLSSDGFLLFVCSARQNLGKRLLWIDAEIEFSNGYKRKFSSISFHLLTGTAVAVAKLDFAVTPHLTVKSFRITSAPAK